MALMDFLKKVKNVVETVSSVAQQVQMNADVPETKAPSTYGAPDQDCYSFPGSVDDYFAQVLTTHFPHLRVYRDQWFGSPQDVPVSFLLYQNGAPKLAVILCDSREYRTRRVQNTVDACIARNIPYQRYFRDFRNETSYVVDRIRSAL